MSQPESPPESQPTAQPESTLPDSTSGAASHAPGDSLPSGRRESPAEAADRNWIDLLQEFRVLQTGVQLLSGFLLTLPFQPAFSDLDDVQRATYLALVVIAACTTATLLTPIAAHRRLFGRRRKRALVLLADRMARAALVLVGLLVVGITFLVFDVVLDRVAALVVGAAMALVLLTALAVVPSWLTRVSNEPEYEDSLPR